MAKAKKQRERKKFFWLQSGPIRHMNNLAYICMTVFWVNIRNYNLNIRKKTQIAIFDKINTFKYVITDQLLGY